MVVCRHECEVFSGKQTEGAESDNNWETCEKNPGHQKFISVQDFLDNHLPRIGKQDARMLVILRNWIDRTVRLRVRYTSLDRPDDDEFSEDRGTDKLRVGTGYIGDVKGPVRSKPLSCDACGGKVMKNHWTLNVSTARHVVYDTKEAKMTKIDLFYDDPNSQQDGRMKSVWGMEISQSKPDRDWSRVVCVTCDEDLVSRIESASRYLFRGQSRDGNLLRQDVIAQDILSRPCGDIEHIPSLIVSHPHAQPKQITLGEVNFTNKENSLINYNTPTCPGSSGATVFLFKGFRREARYIWQLAFPVHNGSYDKMPAVYSGKVNLLKRLFNKFRSKKQINYGHFWL